MTKTIFAMMALPLFLAGCSGTDQAAIAEGDSAAMEQNQGENVATPVSAGEATEVELPSEASDPVPAGGPSTGDAALEIEATADAGSGDAKPKSKFLQTYDEKRKVTFLKKCVPELDKDLKSGQSEEACNCIFTELTATLDGIKERLNPPEAKMEVANEKCLTKYL